MAREVPQQEHDDLMRLLTAAREPMSLSQIHDQLTIPVPKRTLQSRLKTLVENRTLIREGRVRSTKYRLTSASTGTPETTPDALPLTAAARAALARVSQNIAARRPAGYNQSFLEDYRPNKTRYLPQDLTDEQ